MLSVSKTKEQTSDNASAMRLDKRLKKLDLDQEQVEVFLNNIPGHCFRRGMTTEEFINNVNEITRVSSKTKVPIDNLQNFITDKQKELDELRFEIIFKRSENAQLRREHNVTKVQLQAFMAWLPFLIKLLALRQILSSMDIEKMVVNKDSPATNAASLRNSKEFIKNLNEDQRSEQ